MNEAITHEPNAGLNTVLVMPEFTPLHRSFDFSRGLLKYLGTREDQYHQTPGMPITVHPRTRQAMNKLQAKVASLKSQNNELQDEKNALQTETTELKKTNEQLEAQNTELKKTIEQLEKQVGDFGTEVSHTWVDQTRLDDRLYDAETQLAAIREELAASKRREIELKGQLEFERSLRD